MKWMLVIWDVEEKTWKIIHHSHDFPDAYDTYIRYKEVFPDIQLMIDIREVVSIPIHEQIYSLRKQIVNFDAEYRRKHDVKVLVEGLGD